MVRRGDTHSNCGQRPRHGLARPAGLAAAIMALMASPALSDPLPTGWQAQNVTPVGYVNLHPGRAFKVTLKPANGRWYAYVAYTDEPGTPGGFEILDVTDPANPRSLKWVDVPLASGQITLHGDLMLVGSQVPFTARSTPQPFAGTPAREIDLVTFWDVSNPAEPKKISAFRGKGWGTHRNLYAGGRYAYLSAFLEGYRGQSILVALDISDPKNPKEAWRFWQPGQREDETPLPGQPMAYHGPPSLSADGKTMTVGYAPRIINFDISGPAPKEIGSLMLSPLNGFGPPALHTVESLGAGYLHVTSEIEPPGCDAANVPFAAIVDNSNLARPRIVANYPRPTPPAGWRHASFCDTGGRFGPHNVNSETHLDYVEKPTNGLVFQTYFTAGVRTYDVSNPYYPVENGWFLPQIGRWDDGARGPEDVIVDNRGNAFVTTGREHGLWVLRFNGPRPGAPKRPTAAPRRPE